MGPLNKRSPRSLSQTIQAGFHVECLWNKYTIIGTKEWNRNWFLMYQNICHCALINRWVVGF